MQPVYRDDEGVWRFRKNRIVAWLAHLYGLNNIADGPFSDEDRAQLAQLLGYSVEGWADLSYVTDQDYRRAQKQIKKAKKGAK